MGFPDTEFYDPFFHEMVAAFQGNGEAWRRANLARRDAIVEYAARRCPYYASVVKDSGDFSAIPLLNKSLVRENFDDLLAEGVSQDRRVKLSTSGSSGDPLVFYRDLAQGPLEHGSAERFLRWLHEIPSGATIVWLSSIAHSLPAYRVSPVVGLTPEKLLQEMSAWEALGPYAVYGSASTLSWIADEIERLEYSLMERPICLITTADTMTELALRRIQRVFECPVHSWYGSTEVSGYVAGTLPNSRRYVFNPLLCHVEVLDEAGEEAARGEMGRIVITDLNNLVMPFIRYDTGDLGRLTEEGYVGGWALLDSIEGRSSDVIIMPSGQILSAARVGGYVFHDDEFDPWIRFYQCAQTGPNQLDFRVVWEREPTDEVIERVRDIVKTVADPDTEIRVTSIASPGRLPSGKVWVVRREFGEDGGNSHRVQL